MTKKSSGQFLQASSLIPGVSHGSFLPTSGELVILWFKLQDVEPEADWPVFSTSGVCEPEENRPAFLE